MGVHHDWSAAGHVCGHWHVQSTCTVHGFSHFHSPPRYAHLPPPAATNSTPLYHNGLDAGRVPVAALPDLMRAAGHFPSQADTDSLLAHVRFMADLAPADDALVCSGSGGGGGAGGGDRSVAQQAAAEGVDVDTFLLLYLSHRPVVDFDKQQVEAAFRTLRATTAAGEVPRVRGSCTSRPKPQAGDPCRGQHLVPTWDGVVGLAPGMFAAFVSFVGCLCLGTGWYDPSACFIVCRCFDVQASAGLAPNRRGANE